MAEIIILDEKQAKAVRLDRAQNLARLFDPENERVLSALRSFLQVEAETAKDNILLVDEKRDYFRGKHDLAVNLISDIQSEISWGLVEVKKAKQPRMEETDVR